MMICAQFEMRQQGDWETPSQDHDEGAAPEGRCAARIRWKQTKKSPGDVLAVVQ